MWRRGDEVFAEVALPQDVPARRVRRAPGAARRRAARGGRSAADDRRAGAAVLLAGGVAARGGRVGGARPDRAAGPSVGVDRTGRRAGAAGAVGGVDGRPPGHRRSSWRRRSAVEHRRRAVRGRAGRRRRLPPAHAATPATSRCSNPSPVATRSDVVAGVLRRHPRRAGARCSPGWPSRRACWWSSTRGAVALPGEDVTDLAGCRGVGPGACGADRATRAASCWWMPMRR